VCNHYVAPIDDSTQVQDPRALRALAHPLRISLLAALRRHGPATATQLGRRLDETSGATSYHLRQLARHGFVTEDVERGTGRERWWRATAEMTSWRSSDFEGDPEGREADDWLLRHQSRFVFDSYERWLAVRREEDEAWREAAALSDYQLRIGPQVLAQLKQELYAVVERYRHGHSDDPEARDVIVGLVGFPVRDDRPLP